MKSPPRWLKCTTSSQFSTPVFILVYKYSSLRPESACCRDYTIPQPRVKLCIALRPLWRSLLIKQRKGKSNFSENKLLSLPGVSDGRAGDEAPRLKSQLLQSAHIKEWVRAAIGELIRKMNRQRRLENCKESCRDMPSTTYFIFVPVIHTHTHMISHTHLQ